MLRANVIIAALVASLAVSLVGSAAASAAGWMVNATNLATTAALATTAKVDKSFVSKFSGLTLECTGETINGVAPLIQATNKGSATSLGFTGCASVGSKCQLSGTTINTFPISAETTLDGPLATVTTIKPETGTVFAIIIFTGATCPIAEEEDAIGGKIAVLAPTGQDERTVQQINVATAGTALFLDEFPLTLEGSALLKLASGQPWSFL